MKIYRMTNVSDDYMSIVLKEQSNENYNYLKDKFEGKMIGEDWVILDVISFNKGKKKESDAIRFWDKTGAIVLSEKAVGCLKDMLQGVTEILPLNHPKFDLYIVNVVNVIDALDENRSEITRFPDGNIMRVDKHSFTSKLVEEEHHIFKIPQSLKSHSFVSEKFVNTVNEFGLKGFVFKEVWNSANSLAEASHKYCGISLPTGNLKINNKNNSSQTTTIKVTFNIRQSDIGNLHQALSSYMDKNQQELIESCWPFIKTATFITKTSWTDEALAVVSEYVLKFVNELLNNEPSNWRENYISGGGKELSLVNIAAIEIG